MILLTQGIKIGKGGVCQAIENLKAPWQVIIMLIVSGGQMMPTLTQFIGMLSALVGAIIILNKK